MGACGLQRYRHQALDQAGQLDLAGKGLRRLEERRGVELPPIEAECRHSHAPVLTGEAGELLVELRDFAVRTPKGEAMTRIAQIGIGTRPEAAAQIEATGKFVRDAFVV